MRKEVISMQKKKFNFGISFYTTEKLYDSIKEAADKNNISYSEFIRKAVEKEILNTNTR